MKKTGGEIEKDIYDLLRKGIKAKIKGDVYLRGTRPLNSSNEDAIISFMTGLDNQLQTGVVNINIYVPNIDNGSSALVKNIKRCIELERYMLRLIEEWSVKSEYHFSLGQTIHTFSEDEINQHFINVKIKFKRFS